MKKYKPGTILRYERNNYKIATEEEVYRLRGEEMAKSLSYRYFLWNLAEHEKHPMYYGIRTVEEDMKLISLPSKQRNLPSWW